MVVWCRGCWAEFGSDDASALDECADHQAAGGCVMPAKTPRRCGTPGCSHCRPCPDHAAPPWAGSNRKDRLPANWEQLRAYVLRRDRHRCYRCGAPASDVDHVVRGDDHRPSNLRAICTPCHRVKSALEGVAARRAARAGR